jgi:hypothetical protein
LGFFLGSIHEASLFTCSAFRIYCAIDETRAKDFNNAFQSKCPSDYQDLQSKHCRNLFWLIYILDKELSLQTSRPSSINDNHFRLHLPHDYRQQVCGQQPELPISHADSCDILLFYDHRLALIKSKVFDELYSIKATAKSNHQLVHAISTLDALLECWRATLPPRLRPGLCALTEDSANIDMRAVMMALSYYDCLSAIHGASSRCRKTAPGQLFKIEIAGSTLNLAVKASRNAVQFLLAARKSLESRYLW